MSLSSLLWVSLYLHPKWQKDEMIFFFTSFRRHSYKITSLTWDLASLPGRAQIPRNCEHSTMDRGNLEMKWNIASTHWSLVFLFFVCFFTCLTSEAVMLWFVRVKCRHSPGDVQGSLLLLTHLLVFGGGVKFSCSHGFRRSERRTTFLALNTNTLSDICIYVCIKHSDGLDFYTTYHYLMTNIEWTINTFLALN